MSAGQLRAGAQPYPGAEPARRSWRALLSRRFAIDSTTRLDALRVVVGALLAVHVARSLSWFGALVGRHGILALPAELVAGPWRQPVAALQQLPPPGPVIWVAGGVALAALIALGIKPRWCAALLFVQLTITHESIAPVATLDDHFARVLCCWLALLPIGQSLVIGRRAPRPAENRGVSPVVVASLGVFACLVCLHAAAGSERALFPSFVWFALALAAAPLGFASRGARYLSAAPAVLASVHILGFPGAWLTACSLLALHALFVVSPALDRPAAVRAPARLVVDGSAAIALSLVALELLSVAAAVFGLPQLRASTGSLMRSVGLRPLGWELAAAERFQRTRVTFVADTSAPEQELLATSHWRVGLLFEAIERAPRPMAEELSRAIMERLANAHCASARPGDAPGKLLWSDAMGSSHALGWLECSCAAGRCEPYKMVVLDPRDREAF
jgi:hypothetical protein